MQQSGGGRTLEWELAELESQMRQHRPLGGGGGECGPAAGEACRAHAHSQRPDAPPLLPPHLTLPLLLPQRGLAARWRSSLPTWWPRLRAPATRLASLPSATGLQLQSSAPQQQTARLAAGLRQQQQRAQARRCWI